MNPTTLHGSSKSKTSFSQNERERDSIEQTVSVVLPKNQNKYAGMIRSYDNRCVYEYQTKTYRLKEVFWYDKLGGKEESYNAALHFQKKFCQNHGLVTNLYYIINHEFIIVELNQNKKMIVDLEDVPLIEKYNWRIQNNIYHPTTFQQIEGKRYFITFYFMKYHCKKIRFKNKHTLDYRRSNVILMENIQPSLSIQHSNHIENVENHIETSQNEESSSSKFSAS